MSGEVIEPIGLLEIYCDGFEEHERQGHNISCIAVRNTKNGKVAVARLTFPASSTESAIEDARAALADDKLLLSDQPGLVPSKLPN